MSKGKYIRTEKHRELARISSSGRKQSFETIEKRKKSHKGDNGRRGTKQSEETKKKIGLLSLGRKHTVETRLLLSNVNKGEKGPNWQGGIYEVNKAIRRNIEYRLWREAVFARDNWTCQKYGIKEGALCCHHIQNFSKFPELRTSIENGVTLSTKAHMEFHKKYGIRNNTKEQLEEFLNNLIN